MEFLFVCVIALLFILAVFDLSVGVSNDAVNFMTSALGSKAASFKRVVIVASIGVFIGATMSNGMMDIVRHGIFRPEQFSFYDIICILMAVIVTDIILLDVFNSMGLPTSTTVSMVFELLGATFVVALIKIGQGADLGFNDVLNTEKALQVIIGIFLSVAIAFVFGLIVQFLSRTIFSFNYRHKLSWKIGIYGGFCSTAIVYFLLIKGLKDLTFMTPDVLAWIDHHVLLIIGGCFLFFSILMQGLHAMKVNVLKVVVLLGTFALAMAFAGNDLVNFIGVPLTGLSAYQDYAANGGGDSTSFLMSSLNGPAHTSIWFLVGAGLIMVVSLATSRKARHVTETEIGLGSQQGGDEMFGSSRLARSLVRLALNCINWVSDHTPASVRRWLDRRFDVDETIIDEGAAFDLIRGSVNLVLASALIAVGTSMKLPLSTTFVTFMVAMGTSLADKAWSRESAVFRITGVISVVGGWFLTAGAAFIGAGIIVLAMHFGGHWAIIALALATLYIIYHFNKKFRNRKNEETDRNIYLEIQKTANGDERWNLLFDYISEKQMNFFRFAEESYRGVSESFLKENAGVLGKIDKLLVERKAILKNARRKETMCLREVSREKGIEKSPWFHLSNNCCMSILYNLRRIDEVCREHVGNNFHPLQKDHAEDCAALTTEISVLLNDTIDMVQAQIPGVALTIRQKCDHIKDEISALYHGLQEQLREGEMQSMTVIYVYINMLQETQELVSTVRKYVRAYAKLCDSQYSSRNSITPDYQI